MDANQAAQLQAVFDRVAKIDYMHIVMSWGFDPTPDFKGAIYGEQGEVLQRLRRLGSLDDIRKVVVQALVDDPDVQVDPAVLETAVNKAVVGVLSQGFDAHISPEIAQAQAKQLAAIGSSAAESAPADASAPAAPVDDVKPRKSEKEVDLHEGNDVSEEDQKTEKELGQ